MNDIKSIPTVDIKSQPWPLFLSCPHKVMPMHVPQCVFSVCWYEKSRACHNTLLVFCGQEEPGSAPVTQLLTALVLSFGLTSSACLLIHFTLVYPLYKMSSLKHLPSK